MRSRLAEVAAVAALIGIVAACTGPAGPPPVPSDAEARAHLGALVALVHSGQAGRICELGSGTCAHALRNAHPAAVPRTPPVVVASRVLQPQVSQDATSLGGRVLDLCGTDGLGRPYASELLVFHDGSKLISTGTAYWLGTGIAEALATGGDSPPRCP